MKRPTTGRRHQRSGSIPVTELIRKRPARLDVPPEHRALANALVAASVQDAQDKPASHRRPPQRGSQLITVAGLGIAACVLCGSVALASVITHNRTRDAVAPVTNNMEITGEQALLPDAYAHAARQQPGAAKPEVPPAARDTASGSFLYNPGRSAATTTTSSTAPITEQREPSTSGQLVREFYELAGTDPQQAFALLAPEALDADLDRFVQAWSSVRNVKVISLDEHPDGSVVTVVSMGLADGSHLRLKQLLHTAHGNGLRIVGAELLSAQHS